MIDAATATKAYVGVMKLATVAKRPTIYNTFKGAGFHFSANKKEIVSVGIHGEDAIKSVATKISNSFPTGFLNMKRTLAAAGIYV